MKRLVLDTNTVLALWLFGDPALAGLRRLCEEGAVLLATKATVDELARVLAYPEFALAPEAAQGILEAYRGRLTMIHDTAPHAWPMPVCRDKDDQKFLLLARDGAADYLLTRDKALLTLARKKILYGRFAILKPETLVQRGLTPAAR